jgi:hypothetical protein
MCSVECAQAGSLHAVLLTRACGAQPSQLPLQLLLLLAADLQLLPSLLSSMPAHATCSKAGEAADASLVIFMSGLLAFYGDHSELQLK